MKPLNVHTRIPPNLHNQIIHLGLIHSFVNSDQLACIKQKVKRLLSIRVQGMSFPRLVYYRYTKIGFAGNAKPSCVFPTAIAYPSTVGFLY